METMLSRIARAMAKDRGLDFNTIPKDRSDPSQTAYFYGNTQEDYLSMARAAAKALYDLPEKHAFQMGAWTDFLPSAATGEGPENEAKEMRVAWQAAITSILAEEQKP